MSTHEPSKPGVSTSQRIMKICLIVSITIGCLILILAWVSDDGFLRRSAFIIPLVSLQWFFYLLVKAKQLSGTDAV